MIRIVGDVQLADGFFDTGFGVGSLIEKGLQPLSKLLTTKEDYWIGNCECVVANTSNKEGAYRNHFRIAPEHFLKLQHLNLYSIANNHVMQHGELAYSEMVKLFDTQSIPHIGSKQRPYHIILHKGKRIAIFAFSQRKEKYASTPLPYVYLPEYCEIEAVLNQIKKEQVDFIISYIHWGNEFINYPYIDQIQFAHWLVDIGFDLIVGTHPHITQGCETYKGKKIYYSLGNCVFSMPYSPSKYGLVVNVNFVDDHFVVTENTLKIDGVVPQVISDNSIPKEYQMDYLSKLIANYHDNESYYQVVHKGYVRYRQQNILSLIKNLGKFKRKDLQFIIKDYIHRRF